VKLLAPLLSTLYALRRALAVGAVAGFVVLGTAACDDVLPDVEQGEDDGGQDDGDDGGDDGDDGDQDEDGGDDGDDD